MALTEMLSALLVELCNYFASNGYFPAELQYTSKIFFSTELQLFSRPSTPDSVAEAPNHDSSFAEGFLCLRSTCNLHLMNFY